MKSMSKRASVFAVAALTAAYAVAEIGISVGGSHNYKAGFHRKGESLPYRNNPGPAAAGADHYYDDGYNLVDGGGNQGNQTTLWGYQNPSQDNDGTLTMNSSRTVIDPQGSSASDSGIQPSLEVYWLKYLTDNDHWNAGVRVALRWQEIKVDGGGRYNTMIETISDTYTYTGRIPPPPYDNGGTAAGNFAMGDVPERSVSRGIGRSYRAAREIEADLAALDLGPVLCYDITRELRVVLSAGGTVAWINSEFDYRDGPYGGGSDSGNDCLLGFYAGADVQYQITESWGFFAGCAHCRLEDFTQDSNGRSAELQFDDSFLFRTGIYFR